MKVIVTGSNGLVGSAIKSVANEFPNMTFVFLGRKDVDLMSKDATLMLFNMIQADYVIHLAANVGGLYKNMNNPVSMLEDNLLINSNVLHACHATKVKKVLACLSTCIFPDGLEELTEEDLHKGPPHFSNSSYAYAKRMLAIQCDAYNKISDTQFSCVIPTNIYGPNDNYNLKESHVIPSLIHKAFICDDELVVYGDGTPLRQFIHSHELARMMLTIIEHSRVPDTFILTSLKCNEMSIGYVAETIVSAIESNEKITIRYDKSKANGQMRKYARNDKLINFLCDNSLYDLIYNTSPTFEEGIYDAVAWFGQNFDTCRK
jgi:GDP-L-fucose synthase